MEYHGPKDRLQAAQASDTPPEELARLSQSEYTFVREAIAANPKTPQAVLHALIPAKLQSEDDFRVALGLIHNPVLQPQAYAAIGNLFLQSLDQIVPRAYFPTALLDAFVRSKSAPPASVTVFADPDSIPRRIRERIAAPGVRPELLTKLLDDPSEKICARAKRALEARE